VFGYFRIHSSCRVFIMSNIPLADSIGTSLPFSSRGSVDDLGFAALRAHRLAEEQQPGNDGQGALGSLLPVSHHCSPVRFPAGQARRVYPRWSICQHARS
jgi:hypothetical protein